MFAKTLIFCFTKNHLFSKDANIQNIYLHILYLKNHDFAEKSSKGLFFCIQWVTLFISFENIGDNSYVVQQNVSVNRGNDRLKLILFR